MVDMVDAHTRSRMMAGIKGKNTKPERRIRSALHCQGFRYRLHDKRLPGKPDLVFRSRNAVVFVQGCFWHGHNCHLFKWPSTRPDWWRQKIEENRTRDNANSEKLRGKGWRQAYVWECALKGKERLDFEILIKELAGWLDGSRNELEIKGQAA